MRSVSVDQLQHPQATPRESAAGTRDVAPYAARGVQKLCQTADSVDLQRDRVNMNPSGAFIRSSLHFGADSLDA